MAGYAFTNNTISSIPTHSSVGITLIMPSFHSSRPRIGKRNFCKLSVGDLLVGCVAKSGFGFEEDETEIASSELYKSGPPFYTVEIYENIGKCFLVSILDIFGKNPYSRINAGPVAGMENLRREVATQ